MLSRAIASLAAAAALVLAGASGASAQTPPVQAPPSAGPPASSVVSTPSSRTLYRDGPSGRFLVDGTWLFRPDPAFNGDGRGWQRDASTAGWTATTVPNAWNATDESAASFAGAVGWYRKDFRLPSGRKALMWTARFESVNYRVSAWLNGRFIGKHVGAYLPFELRLPRGFLKRNGVNRLVLRVDSRRTGSDFPPAKFDVRGRPLGGWWNYGGILREVYLRAVDDIDFDTVDVRPDLPCATCAATVNWNVRVRNAGVSSRTVTVMGRFGSRSVRVGRVSLGPKSSATLTKSIRVVKPRLWSPDRPYLYDATLRALSGKRTLQTFRRSIGVRSIKVSDGRLVLNGRQLDIRGVGLQEDSRTRGFAIDNAARDQQLAWTRDLGAKLIRAHYPLHPYTLEQADRQGMLVWSEVPDLPGRHGGAGEGAGARRRRRRDGGERARRSQPSVGAAVVGRQRDELAAGPVAGGVHQARRGDRQVPRPDATRRHRVRRRAGCRLPGGVRAAGRDRNQRLLRLVSRPERVDRRPRPALGVPRHRARRATRTRR